MSIADHSNKTVFAILARIIGPKKMEEVCKELAGKKIHIRKSTKFAAAEFQGKNLLNSKESVYVIARKLNCSPRYVLKLRSIALKAKAAKLRTSTAKS